MDWTSLEGTICNIYDNIDKYKYSLSPKAQKKGFAFLLESENGKITVIADKELIVLGIAKVGNYVRLFGWFNEENVFLATATIGNTDEEKFKEMLDKKILKELS